MEINNLEINKNLNNSLIKAVDQNSFLQGTL